MKNYTVPFFRKQQTKQPAEPDPREQIDEFERRIKLQEELMYGVALFFEGISKLQAGQDAVLETHRKQCRNIIQAGKVISQRARLLLRQVKQDRQKTHLLDEFEFSPFRGHPNPEEMEKRARILVDTYNRIFPDRPRSKEFTPEETFQLMEEASAVFTGEGAKKS
ncbi:MAG: hypothetical protein R6V03_02460 [Kiritimatiellia bacterium]